MIIGQEFHSIIQKIFEDVRGLNISSQLQVNCPMCQQRDGLLQPDGKFNLEINTAKKVYRCWRCTDPFFSGPLGKLIRQFGSKSDYEIYKSYTSTYSEYLPNNEDVDEIKIELPQEMIFFSQMDIKNPEHLEAYNYLILNRLVSRDIIFKYRLGFCLVGKYAKRIIFPSYDKNGNVNYFIARNYDLENKKKPSYDNPKYGKDSIIFNEGYINWDSTVYIVEGVFELITILINTIPLLGKKLSTALFNKLNEEKPNVVILLDPDAYKDSIELYFQLHSIYIGCENRIKIIKLPYEKDLDLIRRKRGIDDVINCLYSARDLMVNDYFTKRLVNTNDGRRSNTYSKYFKWESGSTKTFI